MLPQLETTPLIVCGAPTTTGPVQSFVTVMQGVVQSGQEAVVLFVTDAFGPPITVVSVPVAVTVFGTVPAQSSARVGVKEVE